MLALLPTVYTHNLQDFFLYVQHMMLGSVKITLYIVRLHTSLGFLTNSPQCKKTNIANFVLVVPLEMNKNDQL